MYKAPLIIYALASLLGLAKGALASSGYALLSGPAYHMVLSCMAIANAGFYEDYYRHGLSADAVGRAIYHLAIWVTGIWAMYHLGNNIAKPRYEFIAITVIGWLFVGFFINSWYCFVSGV